MSEHIFCLVTGSRHWTNQDSVSRELDALAAKGPLTLYVGDAYGADACAVRWAKAQTTGLEALSVGHALWKCHGNGAGPRRSHSQALALKLVRDFYGKSGPTRLVCLAFPLPRANPDQRSGTERQMEMCDRLGFKVLNKGKL